MMEPVGISDYEKKEKEISGLAEVQRTIQCLEKKGYSEKVLKEAQELAKCVALEDAGRYDGNVEYEEEEEEDEEISEDDDSEVMRKKMVKKGIVYSRK